MKRHPLSVVILAKNEESNIESCLKSVAGWCDEIILVNDESVDRTVEIASAYTAKIFNRKMTNEGRDRNLAYGQTHHQWVLSLDADERVTDSLKNEIDQVLISPEYEAYALPIRTFIGTTWVRHSGWYPASKIRLFRKDKFRYEEAEVHPRALLDGTPGNLKSDLIHLGYPDWSHFLLSVNHQAGLEAKKWFRTDRSVTGWMVTRRTVDRFFRSYIRKRGFKDGFTGFMVAYFASLYQILSYAKYREIKINHQRKIHNQREVSQPSDAQIIG